MAQDASRSARRVMAVDDPALNRSGTHVGTFDPLEDARMTGRTGSTLYLPTSSVSRARTARRKATKTDCRRG